MTAAKQIRCVYWSTGFQFNAGSAADLKHQTKTGAQSYRRLLSSRALFQDGDTKFKMAIQNRRLILNSISAFCVVLQSQRGARPNGKPVDRLSVQKESFPNGSYHFVVDLHPVPCDPSSLFRPFPLLRLSSRSNSSPWVVRKQAASIPPQGTFTLTYRGRQYTLRIERAERKRGGRERD